MPIPEINPLGGIFSPPKAKAAFQPYLTNPPGLATDFHNRNPGELPVKLHTQIGTVIILASSTVDETAHDERFHLRKETAKAFNAHLPRFEVSRDDSDKHLMESVVTKYRNM